MNDFIEERFVFQILLSYFDHVKIKSASSKRTLQSSSSMLAFHMLA
jgi:hypothetical protein